MEDLVKYVRVVPKDATLIVELPERAVRALSIIGNFGQDALEKAVAHILSQTEAKRHADGFKDLLMVGRKASEVIRRLDDARSIIDGS